MGKWEVRKTLRGVDSLPSPCSGLLWVELGHIQPDLPAICGFDGKLSDKVRRIYFNDPPNLPPNPGLSRDSHLDLYPPPSPNPTFVSLVSDPGSDSVSV